MVVLRSMELLQKKTNMQFKQLDGVLRCQDDDGNRQSLSHKCTELDKQIPTYLGVSKAVLEHVVFCHQEESNWPLQEGAVLKKRFDDIFDSTRYTKALKVFADLKKEYNSKVKDIKIDLQGYKSHMHAAKDFRAELEKYQNQMESVEDQISENRKVLEENDQEIQRIMAISHQVQDIKSDIKARKGDLMMKKQRVETTEAMLEENLTHEYNVRELKEKYRDFDSNQTELIDRKKELEDDAEAYKNEISELDKKKNDLNSKIERLKAQKEEREKQLQLRYDKMMEVCQTYGLNTLLTPYEQSQQPGHSQYSFSASNIGTSHGGDLSMTQTSQKTIDVDIPQEDIDDFNRAVERKEASLKEEIDLGKRRHQDEEDHIQKEITSLEGKVEAIKRDKAKLHEENREAKRELSEISLRNQHMPRLREDDVAEALRNAAKWAKERDEANSNPRKHEIPIELSSIDQKIHCKYSYRPFDVVPYSYSLFSFD